MKLQKKNSVALSTGHYFLLFSLLDSFFSSPHIIGELLSNSATGVLLCGGRRLHQTNPGQDTGPARGPSSSIFLASTRVSAVYVD